MRLPRLIRDLLTYTPIDPNGDGAITKEPQITINNGYITLSGNRKTQTENWIEKLKHNLFKYQLAINKA